jgi:basic amino acid/polyamine antiporter, APA family
MRKMGASTDATKGKGPGLVRQLGFFSATALVVSNMIGTGIFTSSGFLAGDLGDPQLMLLIWVAGAVAALAGSFCYSELGVNFPSSGGEYVYLTRAYGPTWGFMSGWISFFAGFSAPIAAAALAFSDYLGYFFPVLQQQNAPVAFGSGAMTFRLGGAQLAASALIASFTVLNIFGLKGSSRTQNVLTALKLLVLVAFIGLGFTIGQGNWGNFGQNAVRTSSNELLPQFIISLFWVSVSYSGWNAATYVAEEIRNPARTLPLALTVGTAVVATLYVLLNVIFIYGAPLEQMKGVLAVGSLTAKNLFGGQIAGIFSLLMAVSLVSTVNAMVTIGPRLYYAMAKNGAFFASAAQVHDRYRTPVFAIVCQGLCATLMTLTPFPQLVWYIGFTLNFFTFLSVASLFVFRRRPEWQKLRVVSFAYPLIPVLFLAVGLWMVIYGITLQPRVAAASILTMVTGAIFYRFRLKSTVRDIPPPAVERI